MACLNFYTVRQWRFISDNAIRLLDKLSANDRDTFYFDVRKINWQDYISAYVHGTRKYILKDETSKPDAVVALARLVSSCTKCLINKLIFIYFFFEFKGSTGCKKELTQSFYSSWPLLASNCSV